MAEGALLAVLSALGLLGVVLVATRPVEVTAGWTDQSLFHLPTVLRMSGELPAVDVVDVQTATGPLYHLLLAVPMRVFGLSPAAVQILGGWMVFTLLAAVLLYTGRGMPARLRVPVFVTVAASAYVWQSVLWIATDALALAFGLAALYLLTRLDGSVRTVVAAGVAIALVVAVRQTYAWLLVPALFAGLARPAGPGTRVRDVLLLCVPGAVVLGGLTAAWGALAPPGFEEASPLANPAGLSYGVALWSVFAVPLLLAVVPRPRWPPPLLLAAATVGLLAASPAVIWPSGYSEDNSIREGGWLWLVVRLVGDVGERSPLVALLAAVGGAASVLLVVEIARRRGPAPAGVVGLSVVLAVLAAVPAGQAFQKYFEIPLLACFAVAATLLWQRDRHDLWSPPLFLPAALQLLGLGAVVGLPVLGALS